MACLLHFQDFEQPHQLWFCWENRCLYSDFYWRHLVCLGNLSLQQLKNHFDAPLSQQPQNPTGIKAFKQLLTINRYSIDHWHWLIILQLPQVTQREFLEQQPLRVLKPTPSLGLQNLTVSFFSICPGVV